MPRVKDSSRQFKY